MVDLLLHPLAGGHWVIILAVLRVLSVFSALLAFQHVRASWSNHPTANSVLLAGLAMLMVGQLVGAIGMGKPTAVTPTAFAFLVHSGSVLICLGIYLRGVMQMRR